MPDLIEIDGTDVDWVAHRLPQKVHEVLSCDAKRDGARILAGGFIRSCIAGEDPRDIDIFVRDRAEADATRADLEAREYETVVVTKNAVTLVPKGGGLDVQIVHRWNYAEPQRVVADFDFACCAAAMWFVGRTGGRYGDHVNAHYASAAHPRFYIDLAARRLTYLEPQREEEAGGSLLRAFKFARRGYNLPLASLAALVSRVTNGDVASEAILARLWEVDPQRVGLR